MPILHPRQAPASAIQYRLTRNCAWKFLPQLLLRLIEVKARRGCFESTPESWLRLLRRIGSWSRNRRPCQPVSLAEWILASSLIWDKPFTFDPMAIGGQAIASHEGVSLARTHPRLN